MINMKVYQNPYPLPPSGEEKNSYRRGGGVPSQNVFAIDVNEKYPKIRGTPSPSARKNIFATEGEGVC